jgi:hypothetical protein
MAHARVLGPRAEGAECRAGPLTQPSRAASWILESVARNFVAFDGGRAFHPYADRVTTPDLIHDVHDRCGTTDVVILRSLSPAAKLATVDAMWRSASSFVRAGVRAQHPDWPDERIHAESIARLSRCAALDPKP